MSWSRGCARLTPIVAALTIAGCGAATGQPVGEPATPAPLHASPAGTVVAVGQKPEGIAVDSRTGLIAVAIRAPDAIVLLDRHGTVVRRISIPSSARHLRVTPAGGMLLVPAERAQRLLVLGLPEGQVDVDLAVGRQPHDAVGVDGRIFVTNEFSDTVSVIDAGKVTGSFPVPRQPGGIAATVGQVAVIGVRAHVLQVFDEESLRPLFTVGAGKGPTHVVAAAGRFYVADTIGNAILVFSAGESLRLVARIDAAGTPYGIAIDAVHARLWVTLTGRNVVAQYALTDAGLTKLGESPSVRSPNSVAVDPSTGLVFVTGTADGVMQILPPGG